MNCFYARKRVYGFRKRVDVYGFVCVFDTGFTILAGGSAPPDWSAVEDKKLRDAVEQFGTGGPSQLYFQLCQMNLGSMEPKSEESNFETLHAGVRQLQHNY